MRFIDKKIEDIVRVSTVEGVPEDVEPPKEFDIIIMNPPFTRATGRTEEFGEERGLFGFVAEEKIREAIMNKV